MNQPESSLDFSEVVGEVDTALKSALLKYAKTLPPSLTTLGNLALTAPGKVMYWSALVGRGEVAPLPRWPLVVLLSYQASLPAGERAGWRTALPAAVAVELAVAATDLIDEVADDDPSPVIAQYGAGQALNTANLMLVMAQQMLVWEVKAGNSRALDALGALQDMLVEAAVGQHLDIAYETMGPQEVSPDMSGEMTEKKAGALIGGSLKMGALMAGADAVVVDLLAHIGRQVGGIAQISNDLEDVLPRDAIVVDESGREIENKSNPKTDLRRRKRTLPIVYALREEGAEPNPLQAAFSKPPGDLEDEDALRQAVVDAGGTKFAYLVTELYQSNLAEALDALEALRPGATQVLAPLL